MDEFRDRIYKELWTVQEQRIRLSVLKITFVTGLLGIGALKLTGKDFSAPAIYLAPLVAVLFDILGMNATIAIKRIGAFLRVSGNCAGEKEWQIFLKNHHYPFGTVGSVGLTIITFLAAAMMWLVNSQWRPCDDPLGLLKISWFVVIFFAWICFLFWESCIKKRLESEGESKERGN